MNLPLPSPTQTLLLRACLHEGEAGRRAWRTWLESVGDARSAFRGTALRAFAPLLLSALRRNEAEVPDRFFLTALRTSLVREERRLVSFRRLARKALESLAEAQPIVLRGFALAEAAYPEATQRHCHDLDLLVEPGFRLPTLDPRLPVGCHVSLIRSSYFTPPQEAMRARSTEVRFAGAQARMLAPADMLLHVCGHSLTSPAGLKWVPDAWFAIQRWPALDWGLLAETTLRSRLEFPVTAALTYLRDELDTPVPDPTLDVLKAAAARAGPEARRAATSWHRRTLAQRLLGAIARR